MDDRERILTRLAGLVDDLARETAELHAYLIANRVVGRAIAREAGDTAPAYRAALAVTALASDYTLVTTTVMADAAAARVMTVRDRAAADHAKGG